MAFIDFITLFKCYPEPIQRAVCVCIMCATVGIRGLGAREGRSALQRHVQHISPSHDGYTYPLQQIHVDVCGPLIETFAGERVLRVWLWRD